MLKKSLWTLGCFFLLSFAQAQAATTLYWWHSMSNELEKWVNDLADGFNKSQNEYIIKPVYKGNYNESMNAVIAAFRAGEQPHIVQIFEVGTATMMAAKGAVYPVYEMMKDSNQPFDVNAYLPAIVSYYSDSKGNMLSLPFNSSTPVLYYNKDAFKKAGLNPDQAPQTWAEIEDASKKLLKAGYPCGFTTAWQSWIQVENFSAWHNLPISTLANGFDGLGTQLMINSDKHIKHIDQMAKWAKDKVFVYGGRKDAPLQKFLSQECPLLMQSSAGYAAIQKGASFGFGIGMLPYWDDIDGAPQNSIIGGATLWVLRGHPMGDYNGVAKFFNYLSSPEIQAKSHQATGYLPLTLAAYELTKQQGFYEKNPGTDISINQLIKKTPTENSKGLRLGNAVQIRDIIENELEAVWGGQKTAKDALDSAKKKGDDLLRTFEESHK